MTYHGVPIRDAPRERLCENGMAHMRESIATLPERVRTYVRRRREDWGFLARPVLILWVLYLVMVSAILLANFNYIDDTGRVAQGYGGWHNFSRYLDTILAPFLHGGNYLTDVSPLPQMLACLLLAVSSAVALHLISGRKTYTACMYASTIPFVLSPYFLECMSYKYDAPYMALSVTASVLPLALRRKGRVRYAVAVFAAELVVCATYQASSGILPILAVFLFLVDWAAGDDVASRAKSLGVAAAAYLAALLVFKLVLMAPVDGYVSTSVGGDAGLVATALSNYRTYGQLFVEDFKTQWLVLAALAGVVCAAELVARSRRNRLATAGLCLAGFAFMCLYALGVYPFLSNTLLSARAMYGIGACIGIWCMYAACLPRSFFAKLPAVALAWLFFVFAFTYGNALSAQSQWTEFRIQTTIADLDSLESFDADTPKTVYIKGTAGLSPIIENQSQEYQMLNRLVPQLYRGDWVWGLSTIRYYYGVSNVAFEQGDDVSTSGMELVLSNMYETIYEKGDVFVVELK
jgi:hypothetical protein